MPDEKEGPTAPPDAPAASPEAAPASPEPGAEIEPPQDWETRFKYLFADFENFRRRAAKERDSLRRTVRGDVILSMIPTYEAAQRAREAVSRLPPNDPVRKGIDLLVREFLTFFDNEHVTPVARRGEPFRSEWHEAIAESLPTAGVRDGTVLEIVQQGYRIESLLLRPAKVVVARVPPSAEPAAAATEPESETDGSHSG
jgi:molecular chaperone GrpE